MVGIVLCVTFSVLISTAFTSPCNFTDILGNPQDKYFSWEQNSTCYIFALKEKTLKDANYECNSIGGHLTDIETSVSNTLQTYIKQELEPYTRNDYWIGLHWCYDLKYWCWYNGAIITTDFSKRFQISGPHYFDWDSCVSMMLNKVERSKCSGMKPFICKLNLGSQQVTNQQTDMCSYRCREFIKQYKDEHAESSVTPFTPPMPDDNTTDTRMYWNNTTDAYSSGNVDKQSNGCKHSDKFDNKTIIILAVPGSIAAVLLVTVFVMAVTILKYRRLLNCKEKTQRISLVDILNVDNAQALKGRRDEQAGSQPGSTTELLYTSADTYSLPNRDNGGVAEVSDSTYQNQRSFNEAENYSASLPASPSSDSSSYMQGNNLDGHNYSHLNHNEETMTAATSQNTYGIQSASAPIDQSSEKSPTYELYM